MAGAAGYETHELWGGGGQYQQHYYYQHNQYSDYHPQQHYCEHEFHHHYQHQQVRDFELCLYCSLADATYLAVPA